jgi:hypothetical protein
LINLDLRRRTARRENRFATVVAQEAPGVTGANSAFAEAFSLVKSRNGLPGRSAGTLEYPNELCDTESIIARIFYV